MNKIKEIMTFIILHYKMLQTNKDCDIDKNSGCSLQCLA